MSVEAIERLDAAQERLRARIVDESVERGERIVSVRAADLEDLIAAAYGTAAAGDLTAGELLMLGRVKTALEASPS